MTRVTYSGRTSWRNVPDISSPIMSSCKSSLSLTVEPKHSSIGCLTVTSTDLYYGISLEKSHTGCTIRGGYQSEKCSRWIEPISRMQNIKSALTQRSIGFMKRLASSRKSVLRHAFNRFSRDCRTTTGSNVRNILLETGSQLFDQLSTNDSRKIEFHPTPVEEQWRISIIRDLLDIRDGMGDNVGWTSEEIDETLEYLCTT